MLFNSFAFLLGFLPLVVLLAIGARSTLGAKAAQTVVLIASIFFYGWFKPSNLWYLAASVIVNFVFAQAITRAKQPHRKRLLVAGLVLNIGFLCIFKYVNFLLGNLSFIGRGVLHLPDLAFPIGISFFTLSQIMYLVDCYEDLIPSLSLFDHATFVAFFPYVISGPIAKAKRMVHQFDNFGSATGASVALISRGLYLFTIGLFKKVVFADAFATVTNIGFDNGVRTSALEAWIFSVCYMLHLYFDFSGYSDMAIGAGMMLGVEIPRNFDAPLRAKSIIEFWQRWHITLTNFITTYLYTPILRSFEQASLFNSALATVLAMTIAGLWHGPSWTFVLYGALNGVGLGVNQYWRKKKMPKLPAFPSWLATFLLVILAAIYFGSHTVHNANQIVLSLIDWHHPFAIDMLLQADRGLFTGRLFAGLGLGTVLAFYGKSSDQLVREFEPRYWNSLAVATMMVVCWLSLAFNTTQSFVYFKF